MATQLLAYSGVARRRGAAGLQADQARRRRRAQGAVVAGRRRCSIRISRSAPRTRTARASSTSRWPAGMPTATSSRCSPPKFPTARTAALAEDGKSVTWKLKQGVNWHDGKPFTADDVVFNWEYAADPATAATTIGTYKDVKVEKVDDYTVTVQFEKPTPFWADAFVGARGMIIPKHLFEPYKGAKSREAPTNLKPVGTGPYLFVDFKPGDMVQGELNPNYHMANRPYFDTIEMKGGGDAVSAARAVLQTGEYDFAWNMQVEDEILQAAGEGRQGPRRDLAGRQHRAHPAQHHRSLDGGRRRALEPQDQASVPDRPGGAPGADPAGRPGLGRAVHLRPHRHRHRQLRQQPGEASSRRTRTASSTSTRRTSCSTRPAGSRAPTASARRTARS